MTDSNQMKLHPFDTKLAAAPISWPCVKQNGRKARVVATDADMRQPVIALVESSTGGEHLMLFNKDGTYAMDGKTDASVDLYLAADTQNPLVRDAIEHAAKAGFDVRFQNRVLKDGWREYERGAKPTWDWLSFDYSLAMHLPQPEPKWAAERAAFARGERVEFCFEDGPWNVLVRDESNGTCWLNPAYSFRIALKTQIVPLEAQDVPPGSVFRHESWEPDTYRTPYEVLTPGVWWRDTSKTSYEELRGGNWLIKRPGCEWAKSEKEVAQ